MPEFKSFPLPDTAEGLTEAEILSWHVKPGDTVTVNQIIIEIETAKAAVELPCPWAGVVTELHVSPGETVAVGTPIITIDVDPGGAAKPVTPAAPTAANDADAPGTLVGYGPRTVVAKRRPRKGAAVPADPAAAIAQQAVQTSASRDPEPTPVPAVAAPAAVAPAPVTPARNGNGHVVAATVVGLVPLAKPPVRKLAKDLGVDLRALAGTGPDGAITREDVHRALTGGGLDGAATGDEFDGAQPVAASVSAYEPVTRERRVQVRGVRKATAAAMVQSAFTAPHVTMFHTIDVTPMMELRTRLKSSPAFAGAKITPLTFAAKAVCLAARRNPDVNATWDEAAQEIVYKDYVHLGIAAATPRGLTVPKVRDADRMSLRELADAIGQLTVVARDGKTPPADLMNGTFTITNVGVFGVDTGTPIINPGESAILALGAIREMPWVVDGAIVPRQVCQLAMSFDHRVIDGQQGAQFLADVCAILADPALAITF